MNKSEQLLLEVIRPQGEWLWLGDNPNRYNPTQSHSWSCNKCGRGVKEQENFCPNCGAKMKGGTECMDEDAKQASIPYTYNAPQHDWKCGYPDITRGKGGA